MLGISESQGTRVASHQSNGRPERPRQGTSSPRPPLGRAWKLGLLGAVVGALVGAAIGWAMPERYEASSYLAVTADSFADPSTSPTAYAQVFSRIAREPVVLAEADPEAQLDAFGRGVTVSAFPDAPVIEISGSADTPELAVLRANTVAEALQAHTLAAGEISGYEVEIITEALVSGATATSNVLPAAAAGLLLGLFAGVVLGMALSSSRGTRP